MDKRATGLWLVAAVLFTLLSAVVAIKAWPVLFPPILKTLPEAAGCQLRNGPCTMPVPGGSITFSINTPGIPLMTPLDLTLEVEGLAIELAEVDFVGIGMEMGVNRPQLVPSSSGYFSGSGILPICSREQMQWQARVLLHTAEGIIAAPFAFETNRKGEKK